MQIDAWKLCGIGGMYHDPVMRAFLHEDMAAKSLGIQN